MSDFQILVEKVTSSAEDKGKFEKPPLWDCFNQICKANRKYLTARNFCKKEIFNNLFLQISSAKYYCSNSPDITRLPSEKINYTKRFIKFSMLFNSFSSNVALMNKPGSWFLLEKCLKNTCGRVTFVFLVILVKTYYLVYS